MFLKKILNSFSDEDIINTIPLETKMYLHNIDKENYYMYVEKNIDYLLDDKKFVSIILEKASKMENLYIAPPNINTSKSLTKDEKKELLKFLNIKYPLNKKKLETEVKCSLGSRFYELLDYQFIIKEKVLNFVTDNISNKHHINKLIIHMPTGTGKTKTSVHTIISLYQKYNNIGTIVWLAHTEELLYQAKNAFVSAWSVLGNKPLSLHFNNVSDIDKNDSIYFLSYQKLISFCKNGKENYEEFRKYMSICVCDEAHKCLATETYYSLENFMLSFDVSHPKTLIGLTATPGRKYKDSLLEGDNLELALMFDRNIFSVNISELKIFKNYHDKLYDKEFSYNNIFEQDDNIIKYFQDRKVLAKIRRIPLKYNYDGENELLKIFNKKRKSDFSALELKKIGENKKRNDVIIENLIKLATNKIPTILFVCSNEQGKLISNVLTLLGIKNNCIFGDTHEYLRRKYLLEFDAGEYNILINNSILTTGFDSPRIKCVFITRPTNSIVLYSQMLGRGLRGEKMGGNNECILIDVIDNLNKFNDENFAFNYFSVYWR